MRTKPWGSVALAASFVTLGQLFAGGPLLFDSTKPIVWDNQQPIPYRVDQGDLGPIPAAAIQARIQKAFNTWSSVPTAKIQFKFVGLLAQDVTTGVEYLALENDDTSGNIVVLDNNGDIIAGLAGEGNRFRILGWAAPLSNGQKIFRFYSLMNGTLATNVDDFESTLVHEFGHAVGLDHCQIHAGFASDGNLLNDRNVPTMFPTSTDDERAGATLKPDDKAWISNLYPAPAFKQQFGHIRGRLVRNDGTVVQGANVVAISQDDAVHLRFSCVSDYLVQNDGAFEIPVMPGKYKLFIEPIRLSFTGGSSVGPHAESPSGASFANPVVEKEFATLHAVTAGNAVDVGKLTAD